MKRQDEDVALPLTPPAGNAFDDPESLAPVLECCPRLTDLALKDNPVTKVSRRECGRLAQHCHECVECFFPLS